MEPVKISYQEAMIYGALIGAGVGLITGLIPLGIAIAKRRAKLGIVALLSCVAAGAIWVPLTFITLIVFVWLIFKKPETVPAVDSEKA
ncbi:MAG: hypothetical protein ABIU09_05820 [Pyrinomonadaceae bacterium]